MTDTIRAGVIGFGLAGRLFHSAVIAATPGFELAGIVERSGNSAHEAYPNATIFRNVDDLLADKNIRLVVVATPSGSHYELGRRALEAGRDVVIDKPMALSSDEAGRLIQLAHGKNLVLCPFHNRRFDGDFLTIKKLLADNTLGRLSLFESHFDRWRPQPKLDVWRESAVGGGILYDLGPHLIDQALNLFGAPEAVFGDIRVERDDAVLDDAFDIHLYYPQLTVLLRATCLASGRQARFVLHGTRGSYIKTGLDPQEDALRRGGRFEAPWGEDAEDNWGTLVIDDEGTIKTTKLRTLAGDYRAYYASVRDALLGAAPPAVTALDAWKSLRVMELARESSVRRAALPYDLSDQP